MEVLINVETEKGGLVPFGDPDSIDHFEVPELTHT